MSKVLEVKNLRVSFRTNNGNVKAVRGISFDLNKGETLAIVGESGSGKSVTAKSIIGINAANAVIEGGEIIYKGEDLLKYSEKEFNKVRGNELTMVFQDPLSSLDPIMKIGRQMTEATILNNKTKRKNAKAELKQLKKLLTTYMKKAGCTDTSIQEDHVAKALQTSDEEKRAVKVQVTEALTKALPVFQKQPLDEKAAKSTAKSLIKLVNSSIDHLSLEKNSTAYTFHTSMDVNLSRYFSGVKNNPKEERRVSRETIRREKKLQQKKAAPKVVPANLIDLELTRRNIIKNITDLLNSYQEELSDTRPKDYQALAASMLVYLNQKQEESVKKVTKQEAYDKAIKIMTDVGIKDPEKRFHQYPHEFSGGMRQRIVIGIARAIIMNPDLIIADEPVSALDVSIQAQVMNLLNELRKDMGLTILFIAHDLSVVKYFSNRIIVMYFGKIVEIADSDELFSHPLHPYTCSLLSAIPLPDPHYEKQRKRIVYVPEDEHDYSMEQPTLREIAPGHFVSCNTEEFEKYRKKLVNA